MSEPRSPDVITSVFLKPSLRASGPIISCAPGPSMARGNGWNSLIGNGLSSSSTCMAALSARGTCAALAPVIVGTITGCAGEIRSAFRKPRLVAPGKGGSEHGSSRAPITRAPTHCPRFPAPNPEPRVARVAGATRPAGWSRRPCRAAPSRSRSAPGPDRRELRGADREWSTSDFGTLQVGGAGGQRLLAEPAHALRVRPVQRQPGEELGRHAPALAGVVVQAALAGAPGLRLAQLGEQLRVLPHLLEPARASARCRPGTARGWRTGRRTRHRPGRSGTPPAPPRTGSARAAPRRRRRGGRTSRRSARPRRGRPASRRAGAAAPRCGCSSSHTSAPRPDGRSRVIRSWAPNLSAMALNSSSWSTFCRVITTLIFGWAKPADGQVLQRPDGGVVGARARARGR